MARTTALAGSAFVAGVALLAACGGAGSSVSVPGGPPAAGAPATPADDAAEPAAGEPCDRMDRSEVSDVMGVTIADAHVEPLVADDGCVYVVAGSDDESPAFVLVQASSEDAEEEYDLSRVAYGPGEDLDGVGEKAFVVKGDSHEPKAEAYADGVHYRVWVLQGSTQPFPDDVDTRAVTLLEAAIRA